MGKTVIVLSSATLAMKGQRLLQRDGIRCGIERTHNQKGGCAHGLVVQDRDVERSVELLRINGIFIEGLIEGRD